MLYVPVTSSSAGSCRTNLRHGRLSSRAEVDDEEESVPHPNGRNRGRVGSSPNLPPVAMMAMYTIRNSNIVTFNRLLKEKKSQYNL